MLSSLGEMMDYYVEDLKQRYNPFKQRGTILPDALSEQQADSDKNQIIFII